MTLVLYRRRAFTTKLEVRRAMWRAFDTAVRRKPLAGAADAVYGNSIDFQNRCQKRDSAKTLLLMLIDVVVLAFIWIIVARGGLLFKTTVQTTVSNACISHALASAARAASFSRAIRNSAVEINCRNQAISLTTGVVSAMGMLRKQAHFLFFLLGF